MEITRRRTRPWKVHVRNIGPNFSYGSEAKARAMAERLVSGETWDGGARGLLGGWLEAVVYCSEIDPDPEVLLRRTTYRREGREDEVIRRGGGGWQPEGAE